MRMRLTNFQGEIPRLYKTVLPEGAAQLAKDVTFERGTIKAMQADQTVHTAGAAFTDFYLHKGATWLTFSQDVDVAPGPVATDRLYITKGGTASPILKDMANGGTEYDLGLPTPSAPPLTSLATDTSFPGSAQIPYDPTFTHTQLVTAVFNDVLGRDPEPTALAHYVGALDDEEATPGTGLTDEAFIAEVERNGADVYPPDTTDRTYVYTWVSNFDEESLPSPPSTLLGVPEGSTVNVSLVDSPPGGTRINRIRVYCSETTALGATEFFFVKELNTGVSLYVHDIDADPLQELLPSADYDPPVDGLEGIIATQAGMMAAFKDKTVYFCEPFKPHAWPQRYELITKDDVVALVGFGNMVAVLTTGEPYICQGTSPENMIIERIEQNAPCLSKDGVVDLGYAAAYPSTDGLITLSQSGGAQLVTRGLFSREQWRDMDPATFSAGVHDGSYVFTYLPVGGGSRQTGIIALGDQPSFIKASTVATDYKFDVYTGDLHYADGLAIKSFNDVDSAYLGLEWQSGQLHLPTITSFAAILIEGDELDNPSGFQATIYRDGVLHSTTTTLNEPARVAAGLGRRWSVKVEGKVQVSRITLAGSVEEIWS